MKEATFQYARGAARGAVSESRSVCNRPWSIACPMSNGSDQCVTVWDWENEEPAAKVLVDPLAAPIGNRCRLCSGRGTRSHSQLWRYTQMRA